MKETEEVTELNKQEEVEEVAKGQEGKKSFRDFWDLRVLLGVILLPIYLLFVKILFSNDLIESVLSENIIVPLVITIIGILVIVMILLLRYLNTNSKERKRESLIYEDNVLKNKFNFIDNKLRSLTQERSLNNIDVDNYLKETYEVVKKKLITETSDDLKESWKEEFEKQENSNEINSIISRGFRETFERIRYEISRLKRNSSLNLVLGIYITMMGIGILVYSLYIGKNDFDTVTAFLINFLPKLSLVIFVEIFAYFFLSLYKSSLNEIKFHQNELTKLEMKYIALSLTNKFENKESQVELTRELFIESNYEISLDEKEPEEKDRKLSGDNITEIVSKLLEIYKKEK